MDRVTRLRTREIFGAARLLSPSERAAFFASLAPAEQAVQSEVEAMLASLDEADSVLIRATLGAPPPTSPASPDALPDHIGPYKILQEIGHGGFGLVYLAEQEHPVRRRVALKVIKLGMDTRQVIARFEAERQALALMDHPGIAKVFDAGATPDGRPYFAMELVRGESITSFCDSHRLSIPDRIHLFRSVCEAVQHAHQRGIIHRDIKPSNVLVALSDVGGGAPVAKVIDFGIAKAVDQRLTDKTLFTEHRQMIGTPEYMSPEQAEMTAVDIDTRADVYSLGVLLYELLTGATPLDPRALRSAEFAHMQRLIRETEPPRPSTRVRATSSTSSTSTAPNAPARPAPSIHDIAAHRCTNPALLSTTLRGDLDWITMKAMEKDRTRRYLSALALSEDLARHLNHEPVLAGPQSRLYRARRLVRRNRGVVIAASTILTALLAGLLVALLAMRTAQRERDTATLQREESQRLTYRTTLDAALGALDKFDAAPARRALDRSPLHLRGWEWEHLVARADRSLASLTPGAPKPITVWTLPRADHAVAAQDDHPVSLFDLATGRTLRTYPQPLNGPRTLSVSRDASRLLIGSDRGPLVLWNLTSGAELWRLDPRFTISTEAFGPDDRHIAALDTTSNAMVFLDPADGQILERVEVDIPVRSPPRFVDRGSAINFWTGSSEWALRQAELRRPAGVTQVFGVRVGRHQDRCAGGVGEFGLHVLDCISQPNRVMHFQLNALTVADFDINPTATLLVIGDASGLLSIWDIRNADHPVLLHQLLGHTSYIRSVEFTADGRRIVSADSHGVVKLWPSPSVADPWLHPKSHRSFCEAFSPDASLGASGVWGLARVFDVPTGRTLWERNLSRLYIRSVAFSPDTRTLACIDGNANATTIFLLDARTGHDRRPPFSLPFPISAATYTPDGDHLLVAGLDRRLRLVDLNTAAVLAEAPAGPDPIRHLIIDPTTNTAFSCSPSQPWDLDQPQPPHTPHQDSHDIRTWTLPTLTPGPRIGPHTAPVSALTLANGGRVLFAAAADGSVVRWDRDPANAWRAAWRAAWRVRPSTEYPASLAASLPRNRLAVAGADASILLLDAATGEPITTLHAAPGFPRLAMFSPTDGALLVSSERFDVQAFETAPPAPTTLSATPAGSHALDPRLHARAAISIVNDLLTTHWTIGRVNTFLRSADAPSRIDPLLLPHCLAEAAARANADSYLNSEAIVACMPRDTDRAIVERWVVTMEEVSTQSPRHAYLNTLALLYYRADRFDDCIATARRTIALRESEAKPPHPADLLLLAMALARSQTSSPDALNRTQPPSPETLTRARATLADALRAADAQSLRGDYEVETLINEANTLLPPIRGSDNRQ